MSKYRFLALAAVVLLATSFAVQSDNEKDLVKRAEALHKEMFTIDTHNDTAVYLNHPDMESNLEKGQVTFEKMKQGGLDACFFAIYIGQGPKEGRSMEESTKYAKRELELFTKYVKDRPDEAEIAYCADDYWRIKKEGKSIVTLAIENGHAVGEDLSNVEMFYNMGVRAMTLSHNYNNAICDSSKDSVAKWGGLSPFGYQVVAEMNKLGMIVDVSHTSTETLYDCVAASKAPIVATHSCVRAIKDIARNLTDDEIRAIASTGGLIQVTTGRWALSFKPKAEVSVSTMCDHIEYVKNLVGVEHVGVGTDFDGGGGMNGLEDATKMKNITIELMRRGWSNEDLKLFWGENLIRVMRQVEAVAGRR